MLEMAEDPENSFYYSPAHVADYCSFIERFTHIDPGLWQFEQVDEHGNVDNHIYLEPWQIWVESAIHGFRRRFNGTRLVTTAYEEEPRKNAKSLRLVPAALYDLCCSDLAAEIPIAANSGRQADKTLYGDILKMISNEPDLVEKFKIKWNDDEVYVPNGGKIFKLTAKGEKEDGLNPSLALFEEGHAGAASVYKVVSSAFGARPNALKRMISTAGWRPEGPAYDLRKEAILILTGGEKHEDFTFFAAIYTLDEEDYLNPETKAIEWSKLLDEDDEHLLAKANPMYRISLDPDSMRSDKKAAKRRPDLQGELARTRYNIWTGSGRSLVEPSAWAACKRDINPLDFRGCRNFIGIDLAQYHDMCAILHLFEVSTGEIAVFAKYFLPQLSPTVLDPDLYDNIWAWNNAPEKWLTLTEGASADHDMIREEVEALCEVFEPEMIGTDPYQAHQLTHRLWQAGLPVMSYSNSARTMTAPTDDILSRIAEQRLWHDGNPVLAWNAANVHGEKRANGSILPRKERENSKRKVDGFVAMVIANGCRMIPDLAKPVADTPKADPYESGRVIGAD